MILRTPIALLAASICLTATTAVSAQVAPAPKPPRTFKILRVEDFPQEGLVPPPPATGSDEERLELAYLHALISKASPARLDQARWDDAHEDPAIFNAVFGVDLKTLPATWDLLTAVQNEGDVAADSPKVYYARIRPWGADSTLPNCDAGKGKQPTRSYPSGHSTLGYSVGFMLANLVPNKAKAILVRARDYALSREICGVHFPTDTEASHVIGTLVTERILKDPAVADRIAAARAELARFNVQ